MKREFLKELGLEDETINKVMAEHGKTVQSIKDEKEQFEQKANQVDDLKQQIDDRDEQLNKLSKQAKGNEDLQAEIERLQEQNENDKNDYEKKLADTQKRSKIEMAIKDAGAHDPDDVISKIDLETVKLDGDKLLGFDEQLNNIKESKAYLFKNDEEDKKRLGGREPVPGGNGAGDLVKNPFSKEHFNLTEQGRLIREEPEQAEVLIAQAGGNPAMYGL